MVGPTETAINNPKAKPAKIAESMTQSKEIVTSMQVFNLYLSFIYLFIAQLIDIHNKKGIKL